MNAPTLDALNTNFGIAGHLTFVTGPGGLPLARLDNGKATAEISLYGAHLLSYAPTGQEPVLWRSEKSHYEVGKPIRGGVPVCWPWFGPHADSGKPLHGFARLSMWRVVAVSLDAGAVQLVLALSDDEHTTAVWPYKFDLQFTLTLGVDELSLALQAKNCGDQPFVCSGALHSYFMVGNIHDVSIEGFDGVAYLDRVRRENKLQAGNLRLSGETDSAFVNTTGAVAIVDPALRRKIHIAKSGSRTTVVWNPWQEKSKTIPDFGDNQYETMLCIEPANVDLADLSVADRDAVTIAPGKTHILTTTVRAAQLE